MLSCWISRFGDRVRAPEGCVLYKQPGNLYRFYVPPALIAQPRVFVEPKTPDRAATVVALGDGGFDIYTFNLLNGHHPGSDLSIRAFALDDPQLVSVATFSRAIELAPPPADCEVLVQPQGSQFRLAVVERDAKRVKIQTLITRTPPTPVETNIEVAVVRSLGPLRSR